MPVNVCAGIVAPLSKSCTSTDAVLSAALPFKSRTVAVKSADDALTLAAFK
jgi:hypothetical protein